MKSKTKGWLVLLLVVTGVMAVSVVSYNGIVRQEGEVTTHWANVESKLQRRYDLIPNLVKAVKGSMAHEEQVFGAISDARTKMAGANSVDDISQANTEMAVALSQLLVVMENYPDLTSNQSVKTLMTQLEGTENRISVERDRYNEVVKDYNVTITQFPKSIVAQVTGFTKKDFFEGDQGVETVPVVELEN